MIYIVIPAALTAVLVYLPWGFGKVFPALRLKKWIIYSYSITVGIFGGLFTIAELNKVVNSISYFSPYHFDKPAQVRKYLDKTDIDIIFPEFTVEKLLKETDRIKVKLLFNEPLSNDFILSLDALCCFNVDGWEHRKEYPQDWDGICPPLDIYEYSYADPYLHRLAERIRIIPMLNTAEIYTYKARLQ